MTNERLPDTFAFAGPVQLARGSRAEVTAAVRHHLARSPEASIVVFDEATGRVVDLDLREPGPHVAQRPRDAERAPARAPGRPKLGVTAREVTLLPRHWAWLAEQPSGASAVLRRLVEAAMNDPERRQADRVRDRREVAYRVMMALAGDLPGFEEASRALFAGRRSGFLAVTADWPVDVRETVLRLVTEGLDDG
jgi:hypothetical protein